MNENSLKLAQREVDEALEAIKAMEDGLDNESLCKDTVKKNFMLLSSKVEHLEELLRKEGIL